MGYSSIKFHILQHHKCLPDTSLRTLYIISLIVYVLNSIAFRDGLAILLYTDQLGQVYTYTYTHTKTYTYFTLKHTHILHLHIHIYMYIHIAPTDDLAIIMYDDQPGQA